MKCFRKSSAPRRALPRIALAAVLPAIFLAWLAARAEIPAWMQYVVAGSGGENALFRAMDAAGIKVEYPRPPAESRFELTRLVKESPQKADLYALRAGADEQALDFAAAESDWKMYAAHAADAANATLELADFYHRRLRWRDEIAALMQVAAAPPPAGEQDAAPASQHSWEAFERILALRGDAQLSDAEVAAVYQAWIRRYPAEAAVYSEAFSFLVQAGRFDDARKLIAAYAQAFPSDRVFPVKAAALVEYKSGSTQKALAVYEHGFEPLWPGELMASYVELLKQTHTERQFVEDARQRLLRNPDDLNAAARIFWLYQQQGRTDAARQALADFRRSKDSRHAAWPAEDLDTLAQLSLLAGDTAEAARYYFALNNAAGNVRGEPAQQAALSGMIALLLSSSDQPIPFGAGNLAMYRDIATMDAGPGYFNGILSLFFNSTNPESEAHDEEVRAQPYFHQEKAAALLAILDRKYPSAPERAALHAQLIGIYAGYGLNDAVIREGTAYLAQFPKAVDRYRVAMAVADAYARENRTQDEFAIYDRMLGELAAEAGGVPLGSQSRLRQPDDDDADASAEQNDSQNPPAPSPPDLSQARALQAAPATQPAQAAPSPGSEYAQVLDRYLARLTACGQLPQALALLRREVDRDPGDPGIYERLAQFLQQNRFDAQEEEVYKRAMEKFPGANWYDKLARFYLRERRYEDYAAITRQVVNTFHGTELESYFESAGSAPSEFYIQVNLYAHQRFPHQLIFIRNLLSAYSTDRTPDQEKRAELLREHWFESPDLESEFFEELSGTGRLQSEMAKLEREVGAQPAAHSTGATDYAAIHELAEAQVWSSHFEQGAPLLSQLASAYPADPQIGEQASDLYRSLAYFDPRDTDRAAGIERNLLQASPGDTDRLAHIGDIYADRGRMGEAAGFWRQMPAAHPGSPDGYLQAATVFWDYFEFDNALGEIDAARARFHQPALYGYEAGAIDENMGNPDAAVREYTLAALAGGGSSDAHDRLLTLAARPATRNAVDSATAQALAANSASIPALELRVDVLLAQHRNSELPELLTQSVAKAGSPELLAELRQIADAHGLSAQSDAALEKQISLAADPVERMQLELALAGAYEQQKQPAQALAIVDELYRQNPRILGVVRAEVDFNWRDGRQPRAVAALIEAQKAAAPALANSFALEAADKSSQIGQTAQARALLAPLLASSPFNANYIAGMAQTYARAGDDAGLRDFYLAKIREVQAAPMSREERTAERASLERGLIPALTRMKNYPGAMEQYIALLSAYPEDDGLLAEVTSYALRYHCEQQLIAFGNKAVSDSPRDSRFAIVLARTQRAFHNDAAAIDAYNKAIAIRKDRVDLYTERVALEEQLQRYDDACADYDRLYMLTYKDPQWILDEAKVRVRQGKVDLAVQALETIWGQNNGQRPDEDFKIAQQLEEWGLFEPARRFAEQGVKLAGNDLLQPANAWGAALYARIETRSRRQQQALQTLVAVRDATEALGVDSPSVIAEQVEKHGLGSVTGSEWRAHMVSDRKLAARNAFGQAVIAMGSAAGDYFTPEEKSAFAQFLRDASANASPGQLADLWIPAAHQAGLLDVEEGWRAQLIRQGGAIADAQMEPLAALETSRMHFDELGAIFESYAAALDGIRRTNMLVRAAQVYLQGGDETRALAVIDRIGADSQAINGLETDYFRLLLRRAPDRLQALAAGSHGNVSDAAANYLLANSDRARVIAAIDASARPVLWKNANNALVGLYFDDKSEATNAAFVSTVGDATIAERLAQSGQAASHPTGHTWFYYGMRYGVYRSFAGHGDEEDFIAAGLEDDPSNVERYTALAEAYADAGQVQKALNEYGEALQLAPQPAAIYDAMAELEWSSGNHDAALADWRTALASLRKLVDMRAVPSNFWTDFTTIAGHLRELNLGTALKPDMDAVVRSYIEKNGTYQDDSLLEAAFESLGDSGQGIAWVIDLALSAGDPASAVTQLEYDSWIPQQQKGQVFDAEIELARRPLTIAERQRGMNDDQRASELASAQERLAGYYVLEGQFAQAGQALGEISPASRKLLGSELLPYEIQIAAHQGKLDAWLASYEKQQELSNSQGAGYDTGNDLDVLKRVAQTLLRQGQASQACTLLDYVLRRNLESGSALPDDYLSLAEAEIAADQMPSALEHLRSLALSAELYSSLDSAASLLERTGHDAEAIEFLTPLASGVPWEPAYKLRLAQAELKSRVNAAEAQAILAQLAADNSIPYSTRVQAATALNGAGGTANLGGGELALLASGKPVTPAQADRPYYLPARIAAARTVSNAGPILLDALACGPSDEARLMLFEQEYTLGNNAMALAAILPLIDNSGNAYPVPQWAQNQDEDQSPAEPQLPAIPAPQRLKVASELSTVYERTGDLASAASWLATAISLAGQSSDVRQLESRKAAIEARIANDQANASRIPVFQTSLDQPNQVRPRIAVATAGKGAQP